MDLRRQLSLHIAFLIATTLPTLVLLIVIVSSIF